MQVLAVGAGHRLARALALDHHKHGIHQRHGQQPQRGHRRDHPRRALAVLHQHPPQQKTQQQGARVTKKRQRPRAPRQAQVEQQVGQQPARQRGQLGHAHRSAGKPQRRIQAGQAHQGDTGREPVHAVNHIERVGHAHHAEHRHRYSGPAQRECARPQQLAKITQVHIRAQSHQQAGCGLHGKAQQRGHLLPVVEKAHGHQQQTAAQHPGQARIAVVIDQISHRQPHKQRQPAHQRHLAAVALARIGAVEQAQSRGEADQQGQCQQYGDEAGE